MESIAADNGVQKSGCDLVATLDKTLEMILDKEASAPSARYFPLSPQVTASSAQEQGSATAETRRRKAPGKVATVAR